MDRLPWDETGKILLALAGRDFNDDEYRECAGVFAAAGFEVATCSDRAGLITGTYGTRVSSTCSYGDARPGEYAAVVFIGGDGANVMADDRSARRLAVDAAASGRVLGALCAAPLVLARAGILEMRRATGHESVRDELVSCGAVIVDQPVVVSEWTVTADGPAAARDFARTIVKLIH